MKTLLIMLTLCLQAQAADTSKSQMNLDSVVGEINQDKDQKTKEFISLVESKKETEAVKMLKEDKNFIFVNAIIQKDHVLTYSIKNKLWKISEALIKSGSNLNHQDADGKVALMYAADAKNKYVTTMLIASKADKNIKDNSGVSAEEYLKKNNL